MKIVILTNGTRGDIQPMIYLGRGLLEQGHEVTVTASDNFAEMIQSAGLNHKTMPVNMQEYMETEEGKLWMKKVTRNPFALLTEIRKMIPRLALSTLDAYWEACKGTEFIITTTGALGDIYIKNRLHVPLVEVHLQPLEPTVEFAYPLVKLPIKNKVLNKFTYYYFEWFLGQMFKKSLNKWQKQTFGSVLRYRGGPFAERRRSCEMKLGAYSTIVVPKPADWPDEYHICGNFFPGADSEYIPEKDIEGFILSGSAPVYIGFGSMAVSEPKRLQDIIIKIIEKTNVRIILSRGWSNLQIDDIPGRLMVIDNVSHSWLFPKTSGIIHHGGAGTTAAALKAGIPQMIFPKTADQPFWAEKVYALGISPKPEKLQKITFRKFEQIISFFQRESAKEKAQKIGEEITLENGISRAVKLIGEYY